MGSPKRAPEKPPPWSDPVADPPDPHAATHSGLFARSAHGEGGADTTECPQCGRCFVRERLPVHLAICAKVARSAAQRGQFLSGTQRSATPAAAAHPAPDPVPPRRRPKPVRRTPGPPANAQEEDPEGWLRQRGAEVQLTLRMEIQTAADLSAVERTVEELLGVPDALVSAAKRAELPLDAVFRSLLAQVAQSDPDPTSTPKSRPRDPHLDTLEALFGTAGVSDLVRQVGALRRSLRIKVNGPKDLPMATAALRDSSAFFKALRVFAKAHDSESYHVWSRLQSEEPVSGPPTATAPDPSSSASVGTLSRSAE